VKPIRLTTRVRPGLLSALGLFAALFSLSCQSSSSPDPAPEPKGPPHAVLPTKYLHPEDLVQGFSTAVIRVPVRNTGEQPLDVRDVAPKWPCFRVMTEQLTVPPNESATIDLAYAPERELGGFEVPLTMKTNDPALPETSVLVKCRVLAPLSVRPAALKLGEIEPALQRTVEVINRTDRPVRLLYATWKESWLELGVPKDPIPPGQTGTVTVTIDLGAMKGRFKGSGRIVHDLNDVSPLVLAVEGSVR